MRRVIDLCAAPGSWSQVLSRHLSPLSTPDDPIIVIAVDLQPMTPLSGVVTLQADITHPSTLPLLLRHLHRGCGGGSDQDQFADLVLSDGAPDVTGLHDLDEYIQSQLLLSALTLAACVLRPGGTFVAKIFRGRDVGVLFVKLRCVFDRVTVAKPRSSRASSVEAFVVCEGFRGWTGVGAGGVRPAVRVCEKTMAEGGAGMGSDSGRNARVEGCTEKTSALDHGGGSDYGNDNDEELMQCWQARLKAPWDLDPDSHPDSRWIAPFIACGDLSAWDSDATYQLDEPSTEEGGARGKRTSIDPIQKPTAPPYRAALEMRRALAGGGSAAGEGKSGSAGKK